MPEKREPQFTSQEIDEAHKDALKIDKKAEEIEKEHEQLFLLDTLMGLLEIQKLSEDEIKEYAESFIDLKSKNLRGVLIHFSDGENLENILRKGILSHKFSERASKPNLPDGFDPIMQEKYGMDNISFYDADAFASAPKEWGLGDETLFGFIKPWLISPKGKVGVVIKKSKLPVSKKSKKIDDWPGEALIKPRIAPRFFSGLMIGQACKMDYDKIKFVYEHIDKNKIPIYSIEGDQIWPPQEKREIKEETDKQVVMEGLE